MRATAPARCSEGWSFLYDPSGEVECPPGVERVGWSPITTASDWDAAVVTADAMVGASRLSGQRAGEHHWTERSGALLSTLLHAAATEKLSMRDVLKWIDRHNGAPALEILASNAGGDSPATDLLAGIVATDSREQSGIWSTASGVLAAYRTKGALASTTRRPLDLEEFCGGANTLYVCSTGRRQRQFAPLVVAIVGDVRDAAYVRSRDGQAGPPTLLALDEVANIAPIPDLRPWSARARARGSWCWPACRTSPRPASGGDQAADGFLSLFGTTVVLRGIADTSTLRDISALAGDREVAATTISRSVDRWGRLRPSTSVGSTRQAPPPGGCRGARRARTRPGPRAGQGGARGGADAGARSASPWRELLPPVTPARHARRRSDRGR